MITAIILAAGLSRRMGRPKINLPWGNTTVLGQVIVTLSRSGLEDQVIVTGDTPIQGIDLASQPTIRTIYNPEAEKGEMLSSLQIGLRLLAPICQAALVVLGDQPQLESQVVYKIIENFTGNPGSLLVPSYHLKRGHPWLLGRAFWQEVLALEAPQTLRVFLNQHSSEINYLEVVTPSILQDLDTPQEYEKYRPKD